MDAKILETLDSNLTKFEGNKIDSTQMGEVIFQFVEKCDDFDDVETLIFYCVKDESGKGIEFAIKVIEKAVLLRKNGAIGPVNRNGKIVTETVELIILANSIAKFSTPNDKQTYLSLFNKAHTAAKVSFDFQILAASLFSACENFEDPTLDIDFTLTKLLAKKTADLSLEENNLLGIESIESMAKDQLKDKDLAKYVTALKKKIKAE